MANIEKGYEGNMKVLFILCQLTLVVIFLVPAVAKVRDVQAFADQIREATTLRLEHFSLTVAVLVISAEFLTAGMLLATPLFGFGVAILLLSVFTVHLVRVIRSGTPVSCGCTGSKSDTVVSGIQVIRNLILTAVAVIGCILADSTIVELQVDHLLLLGPSVLVGLGILYLQEIKELWTDGLTL